MKVLVTGATGFIGGNLTRELCARGYDVRALTRPGSTLLTLKDTTAQPIPGDILDPQSVLNAAKGCQAVFHCAAAYTFWSHNPQSLWQTNVNGTANVIQSAAAAGAHRIIYTSTVSTIGIPQNGLGRETTPLQPATLHGHYKRSKYEAEQQALRLAQPPPNGQSAPVVIVNPTAPVGPWDVKPTPTGAIILDHLRGRIPAYLATGLNLIDVADVSAGHILALEKGQTGQRYILGNQNVTLKEMLDTLSQITGQPAPRLRLPYWLIIAAGYAEQAARSLQPRANQQRPPAIPIEGILASKKPAWITPQRAISELGLPQSPIEPALEQAAQWFADHGYLDSKKNGTKS